MRQFLYTSLIFELLLLTLLFTSSVVSKTRGRKKIFKEMKQVNICNIQDPQSSMYCYCNNNGQNVSDINCLILNEVKQNDPLWDSFTSQTHLEKLMLTVRTPGKLEFVPSRLLQKLKNLRVITLSFGRFHDLNQRTFNNLNGIAEINLIDNMIFVLHKHAFENMRNLTLVNLDNNRISEIKRYELPIV